MKNNWILFVIVLAQFCCTSLWFASNGIVKELALAFQFDASTITHLTSAVQFGFIVGTFGFALFTIVDRYSPSRVFFICALLGASSNALLLSSYNSFESILSLRFLTGFFLAGIYPVGMKIAADHFEKGLGKSLGFLVGALVLGTAFPHLLALKSTNLGWQYVLIGTSCLAIFGGSSMLFFVPNGPYRVSSTAFDFSKIIAVFKLPTFRKSAIGYFGHMWELYTFWAFLPVIISYYFQQHNIHSGNISYWSFLTIGIGAVACVGAGFIAQKIGAKRTAISALVVSGFCCLLLPLVVWVNSFPLFMIFLLVWGAAVVADSPMLSTLVAQTAPNNMKGTALTIVNCIGFSITIISIQLIGMLEKSFSIALIFPILAIGPLMSVLVLLKKEAISS